MKKYVIFMLVFIPLDVLLLFVIDWIFPMIRDNFWWNAFSQLLITLLLFPVLNKTILRKKNSDE